MPNNETYNSVSRKLNAQIARNISTRASQLGEKFAEKIAKGFAENAKMRLLERATPKDGISQTLVNELASSIQAYPADMSGIYYWNVVVPRDPEGLALFLEYGTGLAGYTGEHPEAAKQGWAYAIHSDKYIARNNNVGWFFRRDNNYVDESDEYPVEIRETKVSTSQWVKGHRWKNKWINPYVRKRFKPKTYEKTRISTDWVFSNGLHPLRYFYDTKMEFRNIINNVSRRSKQEGTNVLELLEQEIQKTRSTLNG